MKRVGLPGRLVHQQRGPSISSQTMVLNFGAYAAVLKAMARWMASTRRGGRRVAYHRARNSWPYGRRATPRSAAESGRFDQLRNTGRHRRGTGMPRSPHLLHRGRWKRHVHYSISLEACGERRPLLYLHDQFGQRARPDADRGLPLNQQSTRPVLSANFSVSRPTELINLTKRLETGVPSWDATCRPPFNPPA
jgi:hypothetical protein